MGGNHWDDKGVIIVLSNIKLLFEMQKKLQNYCNLLSKGCLYILSPLLHFCIVPFKGQIVNYTYLPTSSTLIIIVDYNIFPMVLVD